MHVLAKTLLVLSAASVVWTAPSANASPDAVAAWDRDMKDTINLDKRDPSTLLLFKNKNYGGEALVLYGKDGICYNLPASYNDVASSLAVAKGWSCVVWENINCGGASRAFGGSGPAFSPNPSPDLTILNFNDVISSYSCSAA